VALIPVMPDLEPRGVPQGTSGISSLLNRDQRRSMIGKRYMVWRGWETDPTTDPAAADVLAAFEGLRKPASRQSIAILPASRRDAEHTPTNLRPMPRSRRSQSYSRRK